MQDIENLRFFVGDLRLVGFPRNETGFCGARGAGEVSQRQRGEHQWNGGGRCDCPSNWIVVKVGGDQGKAGVNEDKVFPGRHVGGVNREVGAAACLDQIAEFCAVENIPVVVFCRQVASSVVGGQQLGPNDWIQHAQGQRTLNVPL